jgi:hypothetical protein
LNDAAACQLRWPSEFAKPCACFARADLFGVGQVGVLGQLGQQLAQAGQFGAGLRQIGLGIVLQLDVGAGMACAVDQFHVQLALGDVTRLAQPRPVEAREVGVLGVVAEQQHLAATGLGQQCVGEGVEGVARDHRVMPR